MWHCRAFPAREQSSQNRIWWVNIGGYRVFGSIMGYDYCHVLGTWYILLPTAVCTTMPSLNPFRTAVPFWGQTSQISSSFVPKRDCGSKGVNPFRTAVAFLGQTT